MSLPESGRLALHGETQPGGPLPLNPKRQAMIVRLSAETLEALEGVALDSGAKIDIEFGENSSVKSQ